MRLRTMTRLRKSIVNVEIGPSSSQHLFDTLQKYNEIEEEGEIIESPKWDKETKKNKEDIRGNFSHCMV